jgi:two-component sensor histidine kinase
MGKISSSAYEAARLAAVRRYDILDTPPDGSFDRITAIAADIFEAPISIVSLVDEDRIWFKSHHGLDASQIDRGPGLCASAILHDEPWILTDAKVDMRSMANPLVAGAFGLRFYIGIPLRTSDNFNLGTLCVIDREPRTVTEKQIGYLKDLASVVMDQMELRLSARQAVTELSQEVRVKEDALRRAETMAKEVDHRVMNSLQLIGAILNLQSRAAGSRSAPEELSIAAKRVAAVAQVHRHLYMTSDITRSDCVEYTQRLCAELSGMLQSATSKSITVRGISLQLPTERIVPLGLIVNELVTNAAKHGANEISVSVDAAEDGYAALSVSDDGDGLPPGFSLDVKQGLGIKVIKTLAKDLGGRLEIVPRGGQKGAHFRVIFPR